MVHKPNYCCNCGDKVERVEWHIWNSSRFCELCETEFQFDEWWPRAVVFVILIFGFTGIGFHFTGREKDRGVETRTLASPQSRTPKRTSGNGNLEKPAEPVPENALEVPVDPPAPAARDAVKQEPVTIREPVGEEVPQEIYYCGALTKKGTPCARRVKNGGRCWQHKDQSRK